MASTAFASRLKKHRGDLSFSQYDLSRMTGYKRDRICAWETGRNDPPCEALIKFSALLGVSVDTLLTPIGNDEDEQCIIDISDLTIEQRQLILSSVQSFRRAKG